MQPEYTPITDGFGTLSFGTPDPDASNTHALPILTLRYYDGNDAPAGNKLQSKPVDRLASAGKSPCAVAAMPHAS
jgi:hypothetical protein